jgi:basic membrane protein A and related proteins
MRFLMSTSFAIVVFFISISLVAAANPNDGLSLDGPPKPAFIYVGTKDDAGLQQSLDLVRKEMEYEMKISVPYVENVRDDATEVTIAAEKFIMQGYNVIIGGSPSYADALKYLVDKHPKTAFFDFQSNLKDSIVAPNLQSIYGRSYESQYLCGVIAGEESKSGNIGFLARQPRSVENWEINAYTLGVQTVKPDANVHVIFTDTTDSAKERAAASLLIDRGADVLGQSIDGPTSQIVAQEHGVFATGHAVDLHEIAPKSALCSSIWVWYRYLIPEIKKIAAGGWKADSSASLLGMSRGGTDVVCCNVAVSQSSMAKLVAKRDDIIIMQKQVFDGPLVDTDGKERVHAGSKLEDDGLWAMDWYLKGVKIEN